MKYRLNDLMKAYLMDFELDEFIEDPMAIDLKGIKDELPKRLSELLELPILKDLDGNYLVNNELNNKWVAEQGKLESYADLQDQTGFESYNNEVNLWKYGGDIEKYMADHLLWAESFLKFGLFFSILLHHKLSEIQNEQFEVVFSFGLSKLVDSVVSFHKIRGNEHYIPEGFEKMPFIQGVLILRK